MAIWVRQCSQALRLHAYCFVLFAFSLLASSFAQAAVTVYFSTSTTQADFLSDIQEQYVTTVTVPTFFPNDRKVVLGEKKAPPPPEPDILTLHDAVGKLVAISSNTYVYGFADGMGEERSQIVDLIYGLQGEDFVNKKCAGQDIPTVISSTTASNMCIQVYNVMASTINLRNGIIFSQTGKIIE